MARSGKKVLAPCVYCGKVREMTKEHVFPRGLSREGKALPPNQVVVPACRYCNQEKAADDSYMRDVISLDATCDGHPIVLSNLRGRIARSMEQRQSQAAKDLRHRGLFVPRYSEDGRDLGYHLSVPVQEKRFNRWGERIARGLYYDQTGERLPDNHVFQVFRVRDSRRAACYHELISRGGTPYYMGHEGEPLDDRVVGWVGLVDHEDKQTVIWLVWFYLRYFIWISGTSRPRLRSGRAQAKPALQNVPASSSIPGYQ